MPRSPPDRRGAGPRTGEGTARALAREVNESGARVRAAHPHRSGLFASLPLPDVDGALAEVAYAFDVLGADGVTVESNHHGVYLGDPRLEPLWEDLDRRGAVVFVHPTSPPHADALSLGRPRPMLEFLFDTARTASDLLLRGVLARRPRIRWILTHGGGVLPLLADRMELFRTHFGEGPADAPGTVEQLGRLWYDTAVRPSRARSPPWTPPSAPSAEERTITDARTAPSPPAPLLLRRATVVDTRDGSHRPETGVLVRDGVITAVGRGITPPDGTETVDTHGHYLVPGYNDMHAHPLGRNADLVLLGAGPGRSAAHLRHVVGVVRAGRHYPADTLARMKDRLAGRCPHGRLRLAGGGAEGGATTDLDAVAPATGPVVRVPGPRRRLVSCQSCCQSWLSTGRSPSPS
ncbi:amidohydrolase family protein [Streptomyces sp. NPDC004042]|uniref:amidohydrolase family protein n=1 Tax=Streptomyces sp. NPDC004042 TaxID=3154451 RepID=UPI0033A841D3